MATTQQGALVPPLQLDRKIRLGFNEEGAVVLAFAVLLLGAALWSANGPRTEKADFSMTYMGAWLIHHGYGANMYDRELQDKTRLRLYRSPNPLVADHPPFEAFLLSPLAALPYRTAYLVFALINAIVWLVLPFLIRPYAPVPRETIGYLALWLIFAPLGAALLQGQSSIILLLVYALSFIALRTRRDLRAGIWLGLGLFKFQFVLPLALIFLFRKRWRFVCGFAMSGALAALLSVVAVGWQGVVRYVRFLMVIAGNPHNASYGSAADMATVQGFVTVALGHIAGKAFIAALVAAISLGLVAITAWQWNKVQRRAGKASLGPMFAAAVAVSLVTGFHMNTHDFSPLLLALFLAAAHVPGRERPALRSVVLICLVLFWFAPLYFASLAAHCMYLIAPVLVVFAAATMLVAAGLRPSPADLWEEA